MGANWLDNYVAHMAGTGSPERFARWAAASTVAGVLERKVWLTTGIGPVYPNLYVVLTGEPGVGKNTQVSMVSSFWRRYAGPELDKLHVAAESLTHASLVDELARAKRQVMVGGATVTYNAVSVAVKELGVLLPSYDVQMMAHLTDIYDNQGFSQRRRGGNLEIVIPSTYFNFLAACTPKTLAQLLPDGAWEMGFAARLVCVYAGDRSLPDLWTAPPTDTASYHALHGELKRILGLRGQLGITDDAKEALNAWYSAGGPPTPTHPRLQNYNTRRTYTLLKLLIIMCAARGSDLKVSLEDYRAALEMLLDVEQHMPEIFKASASGGESQTIEECFHMVWEYCRRTADKETPVPEAVVINFLRQRVTSPNVMRVVDVMKAEGLLRELRGPGGRVYLPGAR